MLPKKFQPTELFDLQGVLFHTDTSPAANQKTTEISIQKKACDIQNRRLNYIKPEGIMICYFTITLVVCEAPLLLDNTTRYV